MSDEAIAELLDTYRDAPTLQEAEAALGELEQFASFADLAIGDFYDDFAMLAADEGDFGLAVRAQTRALELGCEMPALGKQMLGWYLMKAGQRDAGELQFSALRAELGDDPELLVTLGNARADAGHEKDALSAFDEALAAAKMLGDQEAIGRARAERRGCREELGLPQDDDDRRALRPRFDPPSFEAVTIAVGWFPRPEHAAARQAWPHLDDDLIDADAYCGRIELHLRELLKTTGRRPVVAPLRVGELSSYAAQEGLDPAESSARASLAVNLHRRGESLVWPPGRNEPCWCRSSRKYKRCCGLSSDEVTEAAA